MGPLLDANKLSHTPTERSFLLYTSMFASWEDYVKEERKNRGWRDFYTFPFQNFSIFEITLSNGLFDFFIMILIYIMQEGRGKKEGAEKEISGVRVRRRRCPERPRNAIRSQSTFFLFHIKVDNSILLFRQLIEFLLNDFNISRNSKVFIFRRSRSALIN